MNDTDQVIAPSEEGKPFEVILYLSGIRVECFATQDEADACIARLRDEGTQAWLSLRPE